MSLALAEELHRLEEQGSTGVLRAGDGEFHLARGAIASAGCRRTIGLDRLVVEAGVATAEDWRRAGAGDPGWLLKKPRLETLALLSVFDAAYFLLASSAEPEFRPAPEHWLAPVCRIAPRALVHECARRSDQGPWPAELVAAVPVVPARRVRRNRVVLTGSQAEVLAAADERRSIAEIARDLGRTTYGCLVAVRDLTTAGLIQEPDLPAADLLQTPDLAAAEAPQARPAGRHLVLAPDPADDTARHRRPAPATDVPALPRRIPSALAAGTVRSSHPLQGANERSGRHAVDEEATAAARRRGNHPGTAPYEPERWQQVDRELLIRLRAALEELA
ncbi:hypothetical protein [Nocardia rhizosphaerihabitans]|uniref:MarR family transcriptional regulator n=1 Tax=Nocardia rhizosphaerihabitans TaxID=1691570 RepID=A0ABQ2KND3_9NOCA|nr:hypothetical protein [Nocardia rhizosphaerihabitans]GGN88464.1 hypothetical protein GCM10011610_45900 [Nocardia rhizosphaerihabitans]